ncbi:hypothetical protein BZA05DRAFT_422787 [Tricharina praecox]|uniref:uncharacterized protein n=1 Tax=Tricharina praecox TaxID=43433 RepID=UPI002220C34F|nr:uncharacterized protein BZA05DRAFT_422787 [Tricharina praecox]KAI5841644.1 hypothetical protein BZA05DRAFT_422787 [Tricharina praecox]
MATPTTPTMTTFASTSASPCNDKAREFLAGMADMMDSLVSIGAEAADADEMDIDVDIEININMGMDMWVDEKMDDMEVTAEDENEDMGEGEYQDGNMEVEA